MARLAAAAPLLPATWRPWHARFEEGIRAVERAIDLPLALIHGDLWAANAVQTADDAVTLLDWDQGGIGPAVLDLGRFLLECHLDTDLPVADAPAWHITHDVERIEAAVEGYAGQRMPPPVERDLLLAAMRFGVGFIGALHLDQALRTPSADPTWAAGMERRFARLQNRFIAAEQIAALACRHLARLRDAGHLPRSR